MNINTPRLMLRPIGPGDADAFAALTSDPDAMAFWDSPPLADPAVSEEIFSRQLQDVAAGAALYWSIRRIDHRFVGFCDLSEIDNRNQRAEVGFILSPDQWGAGLAEEAMRAVIDKAAPALALQRLSGRCHAGNAASMKLMEKLGFCREGLLRSYVNRGGERRDCLIFGLLL